VPIVAGQRRRPFPSWVRASAPARKITHTEDDSARALKRADGVVEARLRALRNSSVSAVRRDWSPTLLHRSIFIAGDAAHCWSPTGGFGQEHRHRRRRGVSAWKLEDSDSHRAGRAGAASPRMIRASPDRPAHFAERARKTPRCCRPAIASRPGDLCGRRLLKEPRARLWRLVLRCHAHKVRQRRDAGLPYDQLADRVSDGTPSPLDLPYPYTERPARRPRAACLAAGTGHSTLPVRPVASCSARQRAAPAQRSNTRAAERRHAADAGTPSPTKGSLPSRRRLVLLRPPTPCRLARC